MGYGSSRSHHRRNSPVEDFLDNWSVLFQELLSLVFVSEVAVAADRSGSLAVKRLLKAILVIPRPKVGREAFAFLIVMTNRPIYSLRW